MKSKTPSMCLWLNHHLYDSWFNGRTHLPFIGRLESDDNIAGGGTDRALFCILLRVILAIWRLSAALYVSSALWMKTQIEHLSMCPDIQVVRTRAQKRDGPIEASLSTLNCNVGMLTRAFGGADSVDVIPERKVTATSSVQLVPAAENNHSHARHHVLNRRSQTLSCF